jgi:membrane protein DedA with SNARE-associated domain
MHTMTIGMFSGMLALSQASYTISVFLTFFVWFVLVVSDEYYLRITNKVEYELTE